MFVAVERDRLGRPYRPLVARSAFAQSSQVSVSRTARQVEAVAAVGVDVRVSDGTELCERAVADQVGLGRADLVDCGGTRSRRCRRRVKTRSPALG